MVTSTEKPLFADLAIGALASGIDDTQTSVQLDAAGADRFPEPAAGEFCTAIIRDRAADTWEEIEITQRVGTLLTVRRGIGGTAQAWSAGVEVYHAPVAGELDLQRRTLRISSSESAEVLVDGVAVLTVDAGRVTLASPLQPLVVNTAQRDALPSPVQGDTVYNRDSGRLESYGDGSWGAG